MYTFLLFARCALHSERVRDGFGTQAPRPRKRHALRRRTCNRDWLTLVTLDDVMHALIKDVYIRSIITKRSTEVQRFYSLFYSTLKTAECGFSTMDGLATLTRMHCPGAHALSSHQR